MKKTVILTAVISTLLMMTSCSESGSDVSSTSTTPAVTNKTSKNYRALERYVLI